MAPKKRLSWEEWQKKANASYIKGKYGVQQMVADWGYPEGMSAETHKIEFDKGKAKRKDRAGRRAQRAKATIKREESAAVQTVGEDVYNKGVVAAKGSGLEEHHKRTISVYAPFFEGLNPKETKELAQWFIDEGAPLGNVEQNLTAINKVEHEAIHNWMKDNFIQPTGKPLLNFKDVPLNERLPAALMFLENVQPAVDERLSLIQKGGTVKFKGAGSVLPLVGIGAGVLSAGQAFAAGDPREAVARLLETGAGEVPVAGDIVQPEAVAGGTFEDVERRTAEGLRARELQQRAAEARQRGGKLSFGVGGVRFALPEFGLSELMGIN
jgi:hypothetical protein